MFPWLHQFKLEEATDGEGGGGTAVVTETAEQKELRETREQLAAEKKRNVELQASEREWSERALRASRKVESDDEPKPSDPAAPEVAETAEKFLDDVSKEGLAALRKRGFVTMAEVQKLIKETVDRTVAETRTDSEFSSVLAAEFPEMVADIKRVEAGKQPEGGLFPLAAEIYRDAITLDPDLKNSKSALIMAARQAAAQLKLAGKVKDETDADRQAARRAKIENQRPDRGTSSDDEEPTTLNAKQKQMAKELGISEDKFLKHQQKLRAERGK